MKLFLKGFKKGMRDFGENISTVVNSILLSFVYLIGVGVTSFIAKRFNKKFLDFKKEENDSYWSKLNLRKKPLKEYFRQF
ncbi:hypothetical protein CL617_03370 [archaeon]|nr:hypothetical protein [archaeon]|tara:strand:- start:1886 stop:2125 length:240 start_codon:yes stop_codon:yes gene_type:complete